MSTAYTPEDLARQAAHDQSRVTEASVAYFRWIAHVAAMIPPTKALRALWAFSDMVLGDGEFADIPAELRWFYTTAAELAFTRRAQGVPPFPPEWHAQWDVMYPPPAGEYRDE